MPWWRDSRRVSRRLGRQSPCFFQRLVLDRGKLGLTNRIRRGIARWGIAIYGIHLAVARRVSSMTYRLIKWGMPTISRRIRWASATKEASSFQTVKIMYKICSARILLRRVSWMEVYNRLERKNYLRINWVKRTQLKSNRWSQRAARHTSIACLAAITCRN